MEYEELNDKPENDLRLYAIPDIHGHAKGEHKAFIDERPIPLSARMLFLWFYHACRRGWPRFLMVTDHMNYLTFEDPAAINLVRRALKLAQAGDLYGAAETASVEVNHAAVVSEGLRRGMRYSIGAEVDNDPRSRPDAQNIVDAMKPDGMIRSVHFLTIDHPTHGQGWNWPFDNPEFSDVFDTVGTHRTWELYMATLLDAVERLPGNIVGHFYVPAVFGHWPDEATLESYEDQIVAACETRGMAIEFNTRFLYRPHSDEERAKYLAANRRLLAKCKEKNVGIAIGSDAHSPKDQGAAFDTVLAVLDACEINELVFPIAGRLLKVALRVDRKPDPAADAPRAESKPLRKSARPNNVDDDEAPDDAPADEVVAASKTKSKPKRSRAKSAADATGAAAVNGPSTDIGIADAIEPEPSDPVAPAAGTLPADGTASASGAGVASGVNVAGSPTAREAVSVAAAGGVGEANFTEASATELPLATSSAVSATNATATDPAESAAAAARDVSSTPAEIAPARIVETIKGEISNAALGGAVAAQPLPMQPAETFAAVSATVEPKHADTKPAKGKPARTKTVAKSVGIESRDTSAPGETPAQTSSVVGTTRPASSDPRSATTEADESTSSEALARTGDAGTRGPIAASESAAASDEAVPANELITAVTESLPAAAKPAAGAPERESAAVHITAMERWAPGGDLAAVAVETATPAGGLSPVVEPAHPESAADPAAAVDSAVAADPVVAADPGVAADPTAGTADPITAVGPATATIGIEQTVPDGPAETGSHAATAGHADAESSFVAAAGIAGSGEHVTAAEHADSGSRVGAEPAASSEPDPLAPEPVSAQVAATANAATPQQRSSGSRRTRPAKTRIPAVEEPSALATTATPLHVESAADFVGDGLDDIVTEIAIDPMVGDVAAEALAVEPTTGATPVHSLAEPAQEFPPVAEIAPSTDVPVVAESLESVASKRTIRSPHTASESSPKVPSTAAKAKSQARISGRKATRTAAKPAASASKPQPSGAKPATTTSKAPATASKAKAAASSANRKANSASSNGKASASSSNGKVAAGGSIGARKKAVKHAPKSAAKLPAKKAAAKKAAPKKAAAKKTASPARHVGARKAPAKKAAVRATATKKTTAKKSAAKKTASKKPAQRRR